MVVVDIAAAVAVVVDNYWHLYPNIGYTSYSKRCCYRCVYRVVFVVAVPPLMTMVVAVVVLVHTCHLKKWRVLLDVILAAVGIQMYVVVDVENYCSELQ